MSSVTELLDDDLTLDACPSPAKDEAKKAQIFVEECKERVGQIPSAHKVNVTKKTKKSKRILSSPVANVMNIINCKGVQVGQNYTFNMSKNDNTDTLKETVIKTDAIDKLFESKEAAREHIDFVATHVGEGWRDIGRTLNYSEGQIYQFEVLYFKEGLKEVIYHLLLDWIQNEPEQATLAVLSRTLWNSGQEKVVKMLSEKLKL